ncbi:MAG TPA: 16S rRNA (guanine(527)-N(7))-methyltransferase RsmG [Pirellulaceae bacterium]|nr:16S rRNA (guanine(527)-N(7))-methyltransferase RsmG [Pirellulaceae bacterium]
MLSCTAQLPPALSNHAVDESTAETPQPAIDDSLAAALARHTIELPADQVALLDRYVRLLWDWNEKLNLTRHTDYEKFVSRDVVDTRELARLLHAGETVLDVGSGGGVPGLVLAILRPDLHVHLTEATGKKARVLERMIAELAVPAKVFATRAEKQLAERTYDAVVVRAVGPLPELLTWFQPHWGAIGRLLVIKGPKWVEERGQARHVGLLKGLELRKAAEYPLPGTHSQSVILKIWPEKSAEK